MEEVTEEEAVRKTAKEDAKNMEKGMMMVKAKRKQYKRKKKRVWHISHKDGM